MFSQWICRVKTPTQEKLLVHRSTQLYSQCNVLHTPPCMLIRAEYTSSGPFLLKKVKNTYRTKDLLKVVLSSIQMKKGEIFFPKQQELGTKWAFIKTELTNLILALIDDIKRVYSSICLQNRIQWNIKVLNRFPSREWMQNTPKFSRNLKMAGVMIQTNTMARVMIQRHWHKDKKLKGRCKCSPCNWWDLWHTLQY